MPRSTNEGRNVLDSILLVPSPIYQQCKPHWRRFDWRGVLPQWDAIPDAITVAARARKPGWWCVWCVTDTRTCWGRFLDRPALPSWDWGQEREIRWVNSAPLHAGLSVREAWLGNRNKLPPWIETLAFAVGPFPGRIWFHDRSAEPDGTEYGVYPVLRPNQPTKLFQPTPAPGVAAVIHAEYRWPT